MIITNGTYCVYVHTNKINGKMYVGQTVHGDNPELRWRNNGKGYEKSTYFQNAIKKYGWENFDHEIIANNLTADEANKFERLLIEKLNTMNEEYGYNLVSGGNSGKTVSFQTRQKISETLKGRFVGENNPNYGNHKVAGEGNGFYGKKHSKETIEHLSKTKTKRYVWCFELNQIFFGANKAEAQIGVSSADINKVCNKKKESAGKHPETNAKLHWCFIEKDCLKDIDSINLLIDSLIDEWEEITKSFLSNSSNPKGVYFSKKWHAQITYKGVQYGLGSFTTKEEAIQARLKAEKELYAEFIKPKTYENFTDLFRAASELRQTNYDYQTQN